MGIRSKPRVLLDIRVKRRFLMHSERREMLARMFAGEDVHSVAASDGFWHLSVHRVFRRTGGLKPRYRPRSPLRLSRAEREEVWVSHEAIYRSLFIQGRGALRKELARYLRTGRKVRVPRAGERRWTDLGPC